MHNAATGAGTVYRFDNTRENHVRTGEIGVRGQARTGGVGHEWVASAAVFDFSKDNAYAMDWRNTLAANLYQPVYHAQPAFGPSALRGGDLASPKRTGRTRLSSLALGDTLSLLDERLRITQIGRAHV